MRRVPILLGCLLGLLPGRAAAESPTEPWPARYGGPDSEPELRGLEGEALSELRDAIERAGGGSCRGSAALAAAARAHARALLERGGRPGRVETGEVRDELLRAGAVDPAVVPWALSFREPIALAGRLEPLATRQAARPLTHCAAGLARDAERAVLVVLGVRRRVHLEPFPTWLPPGDRARLAGRLEGGYRSPSVVIARPAGEIVERAASRRGDRFEAWVEFPATGLHTVEVMAVGRHGPEAVALFPVFVGAEPRELVSPAAPPRPSLPGDERAEAAALLRLLNQERRRAGLPALEPDPDLARLATEHSADMVDQRYFGHVSPAGDDVTSRLGEAGVVVLRAAENLARGSTSARAHRTLMESPAHRANILDPRMSHVGIGVARADGALVVTQILVEW